MQQIQNQEDKEVHRIPLVGTEFSRTLGALSGSAQSSGIVGVGVVGVMIVGSLVSSAKDQRLVNAIPERIINSFTENQTYFISKRPGFGTLSTPAAGNPGSAVHVWTGLAGEVISAFGTPNSTLYVDTASIGSTTGKVISIGDTLVGTTPNLVFTTNSNTAYFYPSGGALTQITDGDFPGNVAGETITGRFVFLDGYAFIMTTSGKIYNSDLNSLSAWSASSYISSNMSSDTGIGLARYKDQVVAFSTSSTEFFQDVGNPVGSPLQRTSQGYLNIGCISSSTVVQLDDTVAWLGSTEQSGIGLYMLEGLQAKRVSTPVIETLLANTNPANLYLNAVKLVGKTLLVVGSTATNTTFVFAVEDNMWHEWSGTTMLWQFMHGTSSGIKYVYAVTGQDTSGKVYIINPTSFVFQDAGVDYPFYIQTSKVDLGNQKRKFLHKLRLVGDQQSTSTPILISYTDDDYQTYSATRTIDMINPDQFLAAQGSFKRRAFVMTYTGANPCRLEALELDIGQGYH